jgi:hypothetical protein
MMNFTPLGSTFTRIEQTFYVEEQRKNPTAFEIQDLLETLSRKQSDARFNFRIALANVVIVTLVASSPTFSALDWKWKAAIGVVIAAGIIFGLQAGTIYQNLSVAITSRQLHSIDKTREEFRKQMFQIAFAGTLFRLLPAPT